MSLQGLFILKGVHSNLFSIIVKQRAVNSCIQIIYKTVKSLADFSNIPVSFSSLSRSLWSAIHWLSLHICCCLQVCRGYTAIHAIKALNTVGPGIHPWWMSLLAGCQLDTTKHNSWSPAVQSISHPHYCSHVQPVSYQFGDTETMKTVSKTLLDSRYVASPALFLIYSTSHLITENNQVDQAWFALSKSVLVVFRHLILHKTRKVF